MIVGLVTFLFVVTKYLTSSNLKTKGLSLVTVGGVIQEDLEARGQKAVLNYNQEWGVTGREEGYKPSEKLPVTPFLGQTPPPRSPTTSSDVRQWSVL